jgi:predicted RNase H-like HicB family nuclease
MGDDRKGKTVTGKTPREILEAIDKALEETAARLAAKPKRLPRQPQSPKPTVRARPKTPKEILDAIDKALEETARRFADRGQ